MFIFKSFTFNSLKRQARSSGYRPLPDTNYAVISALISALSATTGYAETSTSGSPGARVDASEMEQVIVTADFRDQLALQTAASVTVIGEQQISDRAAQHFEEIIPAIPNFGFAGGTNRARFFQIRGIGERSQFIQPLNTSVGVLIDQVDFSGAASGATLFDVEQVEVLRGPQGTRYGANALAGLLNIKTNDPADEFSSKIEAGIGQFGDRTLGLMVTGPLGAETAFRIAAQQHKSDGYYTNAHLGRNDTNNRDESVVRMKLRFQPAANWQIDTSVSNTQIDNGYDTFTLDNSRTTLSDQPGRDIQDSTAISIDSRWLLENVELQLIAAFGRSDTEYSYDEDWTFTGFDPAGYTAFDQYLRDKDTNSLEFRIISQQPAMLLGIETDWIIGVYALGTDVNLQRIYTFEAADFFSTNDSTNTAVFFQLDSHISDRLELSTGLRAERRSNTYNDSANVNFDPTETLWGGRLGLKYLYDANLMAYISLSRGYKAGGFNTDGTLDADLRQFDSEFLWEIETGVKANLVDDRLELRAAIFYDDRRDQQIKSSVPRLRPNGSTQFVDYYGNAAEGTNRGFELETIWRASESVSLFANIGILDATFDEYINENGDDLSGRDQAHAPGYTYNTGLNFDLGQWHINLTMEGRDDFYFSDRHEEKSEPIDLVNASIAYTGEHWQIRLWGRNLTDKDYSIRGFGSFGNDPRDGYKVRRFVQFGEPRILGITGSYQI